MANKPTRKIARWVRAPSVFASLRSLIFLCITLIVHFVSSAGPDKDLNSLEHLAKNPIGLEQPFENPVDAELKNVFGVHYIPRSTETVPTKQQQTQKPISSITSKGGSVNNSGSDNVNNGGSGGSTLKETQIPKEQPVAETQPFTSDPAALKTSNAKNQTRLIDCNQAPIATFEWPNFTPAEQELNVAYNNYASQCNRATMDANFTGATSTDTYQSGGSASAAHASSLGQSASDFMAKFTTDCQTLEEAYEAAFAKAEKELNKDKFDCKKQGYSVGYSNLTPPIIDCQMPSEKNAAACEKTLKNKIGTMESIANWVGNHKLLMAGLLAAAGYGINKLMSSSDDIRDENKTNAGAIIPDKCKAQIAAIEAAKAKNQAGTGTAANSSSANKTASTTASIPALDPECQAFANNTNNDDGTNNNDSNSNSELANQSCSGSLKPLECFVTPQCSLQCVASNFGVSNYGGKDKDSTRIDSNGNVVKGTDPSNTANTASTNGGSGSGSGNSNSGDANGAGGGSGGTGNTASSGDSSGSASGNSEIDRAIASFSGFDTSGGFGSFGSDNYGHEGASQYSGSGDGSGGLGKNNRAITTAEAYKNAIANGPIRGKNGSTLFESIHGVTGSLGVRGFIIP